MTEGESRTEWEKVWSRMWKLLAEAAVIWQRQREKVTERGVREKRMRERERERERLCVCERDSKRKIVG